MTVFAVFSSQVLAQKGTVKTDSRVFYHDGPVMSGTSSIYLIWYGSWGGSVVPSILTDLATNIGASPYFLINTMYPDSSGAAPSGSLIYAGSVYDAYSHGSTLTPTGIQNVVADRIAASSNRLPLDPQAIYIVIGSSDVTDFHLSPDGTNYTTFCTPGSRPHHGYFTYGGTTVKYAYLGNYDRCPTSAPNAGQVSTPNGNFGVDAMASTMARLLSVIVTSPLGSGGTYGGWCDRYGLEIADKCVVNSGQLTRTQEPVPRQI